MTRVCLTLFLLVIAMLSPSSKIIEFALTMVVTAGQLPPCFLTAACKQTLSLTRNHLVPIVSRGQMLRISEVSNCRRDVLVAALHIEPTRALLLV